MIEHTTLHNILTWVIAAILFIFQSLNYFIAWIKKYVKRGEKTTTVVAADTTISSESNTNNNNAPGNIITVQELIQKHFDIPLIIAEDEPKVYNLIKSAQLLTSNEISKEKKKIDQFMGNLVDDSYVARGLGLITATVGRQSEFYLYSKYDNNFENIVIKLSGRNGEIGEITISSLNPANIVETKTIPIDYFYDKDRIKVTYTPFAEGVYTLTLVRNSLSICRSPYYISVEKSPTNSRSQIRLGTKKYKPVTKFAKAKHSPIEICDNSLAVIEISKPPICKNILSATEEHSTRTDVMSMVTKFESNSINFQKKVHKRTSSIPEESSGTNSIDEISKYSNIQPKIETDNVCNTNVSNLDSPSVQSKSKSIDENFRNCVDITNKNSKANDMNAINLETERIKKPSTKLNENIKIKKDIPWVKNVSSTHLKPTNSVLVESLTDENSHEVEIHKQTIQTTELISKNNHVETILDPTTKIDEYEIKYIDNEPCLQNEISCFDDDDRKTVVAMENNNELPSNSNDTIIQQITDSAQYNINTPLASVITKIANSVCEKCSLQVLKTISEFPRDINITHNNNSNEMRSSFETLLAQPIRININIDNMFEHPNSATNENNSENELNNNILEKIKRLGTADKNIKCNYLNEIEPINNSFDEPCVDINNMSSEFIIKHIEHNSEISKAIKDQIVDHYTVPFAKNTMDEHKTVHQKNELSANEIMKIKCSATKEENVLHLNQLNNNTTHKSDNEIEIQGRHLQKSSEHNMDSIKTDQFHENNISKENDKRLDTSYLVTTSDSKTPNEEVVVDELKINNVVIPDEHTNIQKSVINNTVFASTVVPFETLVYKSKDDEEQTNITSNKNVTITSILNENQKLMIEKSIEPVLTSFKNKIIEKMTQLYLNKTLPNTDNTTIIETHDKHLTNNSKEIQIDDIANNTEINTKYIETLTSQPKNHIDKNKISEIILDEKKIGNNHLFENVENLIKTNINSGDTHTQTLPEIKLRTLVNTAMNHSNDQKIDNELKKMIIDNETQYVELKQMNNGDIVQHMETMLAETPSVKILENTGELISSKNKVTVKTQCEIPLINDFDSIEIDNTNTDIKQRMQLINVNENQTIIETNVVEKKVLPNFQKSHNTVILTPTIELQPTLETQITNISELVKIEECSLKEIQTTIEIIESNLSVETDVAENINNKEEYESVKLHIKENVIIKIPHMVKKEAINEIIENISTKIPTKLNSTESLSIQQTKNREIESLESKKIFDANDVIIEREIIYNSNPIINSTQNICIDKPNLHIITGLNAQVSKNSAKVILGINTSFPESTTVIDVPNEPDMQVDEVLIDTEAETSTIIDTSTTSLIRKIVVEFVANKDKKQIEALANILQKQIEDNIVTAREKDSTINSLAEVIDEQVNTKNDESVKYCFNSDDNVKNTKQINEKEHPSPIISLKEVATEKPNMNIDEEDEKLLTIVISYNSVKEIKEIDRLNITIPIKLTMESIEVSKEVVDLTKEKTSFTNSSIVTVEVQTAVEKVIEEESPTPINSLDEVEQENMIMSINTKTKTIFPIESLIEFIDEPKIVNGKTKTEILPCNESSIEIINHQNHSDKIVDKESINTLGEAVNENTNLNIDIQNETHSSNKSTTESIMEPKFKKDTTKTVITSCTDSLNVITDERKDKLNVIEDKSMTTTYSLDKVVETNIKRVDIDTETETHVITESINESISGPKIVEDITEAEISTCIDSSIEIVDTQTDVDKELDAINPILINTSDEVVEEKTKYINFDTKKTTLLAIETSAGTTEEVIVIEMTTGNVLSIESTVESINKPKLLENITETNITSCNESLTEINDDQNDKVKIIDKEPSVENNSPDEVGGVNINVKIDTKNEKILPTQSTIGSIKETTGLYDTAEAQILTCTVPSIVTTEAQINVDNEIEEVTQVPLNSAVETTEGKNIINTDTEKETLTKFKTYSTDSGEEMVAVEKITEDLLPNESTIKSMKEPMEENDLTQTEILTCTSSSIVSTDAQINVDNEIDEVTQVPLNSSVESTEEKNITHTDTEKETLVPIRISIESGEEMIVVEKTAEDYLPFESTMESLEESIEENDMIENEISFSKSSNEIIDNQNHTEKIVEQETLVENNFSDEVVRGKVNLSIDKENETLSPTISVLKSITEAKIVEDITDHEITFCTEFTSATVNAQTNEDKYNEDELPDPIYSADEKIGENINVSIDKEIETVILPDICTECVDEYKKIDELIETLLPTESTIEEPIAEEHKPEVEISTFINSSIVTADAQINVDKVLNEFTIESINSSVEATEENHFKNTDKEKEILLPIESKIETIVEPTVVKDMTEPEISFTKCSNETIDNQNHTEKNVEQETLVENNSLDEGIGENMNLSISIENETLLPTISVFESITEAKIIEDITVTEILKFTDSSILIVDNKTNMDEEPDKVPLAQIHSSVETLEKKTIVSNELEKEIVLPIKTSADSEEEITVIEKTTGILLPIESTTESIKNSTAVEDTNGTEIPTCTDSFIIKNITNIDTEKETLLPIKTSTDSGEEMIMVEKITEDLLPNESTIKSMKEPMEENDLTQTEILACTSSSIVSTDAQINVDNEINEVTQVPLNSSVESTEEKNITNTDTEKETLTQFKTSTDSGEEMIVVEKMCEDLLPIESTIKSIVEQIEENSISQTEILTCTYSSIVTVDARTTVDKGLDEFTPIQIDYPDQVAEVKNIINTDTEKETLLPIRISIESGEEMIVVEKTIEDLLTIESTMESSKESIEENDLTQTEILACTSSSIVSTDARINVDNEINEVRQVPLNSSIESTEENNITNTDTEKEILTQFKTSNDSGEEMVVVEKIAEDLLPNESTIKSMKEPIEENNLTQTEILAFTSSSIVSTDAQINVDNEIDEVTQVPLNSSIESTGEKNITNTDTEKETLLPIRISIESGEEMIVVEKTIEDLLTIESTMESSKESIEENDLTQTEILACTSSSIVSTDARINVDNEINEVRQVPLNSSIESTEENNITNTDTEKEILTQFKTSTDSGEEIVVVEKIAEDLLPNESTIKSMKEPIEENNLTQTEILAFTSSSIVSTDAQINVDNEIDEVTQVPLNSSVESTGEKNITNTDTEKETLLPIRISIESGEEMIVVEKTIEDLLTIESTMESSKESIEENDLTQTEILACTSSSIVSTDARINVDNEINEVRQVPLNSSIESTEENNITNTDTEKEILTQFKTSTDSGEEIVVVEKIAEDLLPNESTIKSMKEPIEENNLTQTEILAFTSSSIVSKDAQINVDNEINEVRQVPLNSSVLATEEKNIINTDTEKEILTQFKTSSDSGEEMVVVEKMTEDLLPIKSTIESMDEPTVEKDMIETEISFTKPSNEMIDNEHHTEKIVEQETLVEKNTSDEEVGGYVNLSIDKENETLSPIISVLESITEAKIIEDITDNVITSCTEFTFATVNAQTNEDKFNKVELPAPIYFADEQFGENINVSIDKENEAVILPDICTECVDEYKKLDELIETLLPTESTIEEPIAVEHKTEAEISTFTESLTEIIDQDSLVTNNSLDKVVKDNMHVNIYTEDETILPIEVNKKSISEKDITVTTSISGTDFSNVTLDVQKDVQQVIDEKTLAPISSLFEVVGEFTNVNVVTDNETRLQTNSPSTDVNTVTEERVIENKYSTPIISSFSVLEKQIQKQTLIPVIEIHTAFADEPNVVEYLSRNEHTAHIDSSTISVKDQVQINSETEIETVSLIDNLTDSVKEQIIEKNTENKNLTLNYSLAEVVEQRCNVKIDTDVKLLLPTNTSSTTVDDQIVKNVIENETRTPIYCLVDVSEEQNKMNIKNNNETNTPIDIFASVKDQLNVKYSSENEHTANIDSIVQNQTKIDSRTENETLLSIDNYTESVEEQMQVEVMKNESATIIDHSTTHDVASLEESNVFKNNTTEMIFSVTVTEEQKTVNSAEVVTGTCDDSLDKTMLEKGTHNETPISINILAVTVEKQTDVEEITENEIPMLVDTTIESVDKQIKKENVIENETTTLITCEAEPKEETDEFEMKSGNETSMPVNYSASIAMKQTEVNNLTESTLQPNYDNMYRNTKTNLIDEDIKTGNLNNPNKCYLKFGETSKMHHLENEDNLQRKSYGIQKLEMSVQRMKTSDEDYYEKTVVQLEQTEKISNVDKVNVDGENKTIIDDKLYTVNESDLNAILCASSLEEALTLLDSKIKFKFKHKKSSSKINSTEYIPKIQTSDSKNSGVNTNFTDAREFFKEIEKKSKK